MTYNGASHLDTVEKLSTHITYDIFYAIRVRLERKVNERLRVLDLVFYTLQEENRYD